MVKTKKVIDQYQIIEVLQQLQGVYQLLLSKHTTQGTKHIIKRVTMKEDKNKQLYNALVHEGIVIFDRRQIWDNEATILKKLNHNHVIKFYKMLKTSNYMYFVYSHPAGRSLEEVFEEGVKKLTVDQKQNIAKQLVVALSEMQSVRVAHLNLTPQNIVVDANFGIMIRNFQNAKMIPQEGEIELSQKTEINQFSAPELKNMIASYAADIYSLGRIFQFMKFRKSKNMDQGSMKKVETIELLIMNMVQKNKNNRVNIADVYQKFFSKSRKIKRMKSLSRAESLYSSKMSLSLSKSGAKSIIPNKKHFPEIIQKIFSYRNLAWLLIRIFQSLYEIDVSRQHSIILSVLLMKKSTKIMMSLTKFLTYGITDLDIVMQPKDKHRFFQSADYYKLSDLIKKEAMTQKKHFETIVETIYIHCALYLKDKQFNKQMKTQSISAVFLNSSILAFLNYLITNNKLNQIQNHQVLVNLNILNIIINFNSIEEFNQKRMLNQVYIIDQQIFIKNIMGMDKEKIVLGIQENVERLSQGLL